MEHRKYEKYDGTVTILIKLTIKNLKIKRLIYQTTKNTCALRKKNHERSKFHIGCIAQYFLFSPNKDTCFFGKLVVLNRLVRPFSFFVFFFGGKRKKICKV